MFEFTAEMFWPTVIIFLIGFGGNAISSIVLNMNRVSRFLGLKKRIKEVGVAYLIASIIFPFIEEIIFRGPIFWLTDGKFTVLAWVLIIVWGGMIFGIPHVRHILATKTNYGEINKSEIVIAVIPHIFLGILLGWLTVKTNSLLPAIIVHTLNNFCWILVAVIGTFVRKPEAISLNDYLRG